MKKLLALVLALVMTLSLCTVTNAAYPDAADIDYDEAVDVMSALGVFQGDEKGNFKPDDVLTRETAAKILTYMLLGKKNADTLVTIAAPYADVEATRWSAGSIAYCTNEGILAGKGDGTFGPTEPLTGLAFAKMCLVALGYDAEIEGLVGNTWSINVAKLALQAGLTKGLDNVTLSGALTREQACQMAFNTEVATMVEYLNNSTITAGDVTIKTSTAATKVPHNNTSGYKAANNDEYTQFCEEYASKLTLNVDEDNFGRPADKWTYDKKSVGTYSTEADATFTTTFTKADLYDALGKSVANKLDDGTYSIVYILNGDDSTAGVLEGTSYNYDVDANIVADKNSSDKLGANGLLVEVYVDEDAATEVTVVMIETYVGQVLDDYDADDEGLYVDLSEGHVNGGFLSDDDFAGLKKFKEDDYVIYTVYTEDHGSTFEVDSFAAAETVTAAVTKYTVNKNFTAGGTQYAYAQNTTADPTVAYALKEDIVIVLDSYGYVIATDDVETDAQYVYIADLAKSGVLTNSKYVADAFFADGTRKEITVKKAYDNKAATTELDLDSWAAADCGWYTYTIKSDKYTLTPVADTLANTTVTSGNVVTANGSVEVAGAYTATKATKFVVLNDDEVKTYDGIKAVPSFTVKTGKTALVSVAENADGYATYVFIDATDSQAKGATTKDSDVIYLLKTSYETNVDEDDNTYYTYDAIVNGKKTTINANATSILSAVGLYTEVSYDSEGYLDDAAAVTDSYVYADRKDLDSATESYSAADVTTKGNVLTIDTDDYILADDCVIRTVDGTTVKTTTAAKLVGTLTADVYVTLVNGEVTAMYIAL